MARGKKYSDEIKERAFALLATSNNVQVVADTLGLPYNTVKTWEKKMLNDYSSTAKNGKKLSTSEFCEAKLDKAQEKSTSNSNAGACSVPRLAEARSRSEENDTQSFSNIRTPLRYLTREGREFVKVRDENAGAQARELKAGSEVQFVSNEVYEENNEVSDEAIRDGLEPTTLNELRNKKKAEFVDRAWGMLERTQILLERRIVRAEQNEAAIDKIVKLIEQKGATDGLNQTERNALYRELSELKLESAKSLAVLLGTLYDKQALAAKEPTVNVGGVLKFEDL